MAPRTIDWETRNQIAALGEAWARQIQVPMSPRSIQSAFRQALALAEKAGMIKHIAPKFRTGLKPGDDCTVKLSDGSIVRGALISARGRRLNVDALGVTVTGEWVPTT